MWQVAEQDIPVHPAGRKAYLVGLGATTASIRLWQTALRSQPNRVWTFYEPTIRVRDQQGPSAQLTGLTPTWIRGAHAFANWSAVDNFGADGIGQQRLLVSGVVVYAGNPGQGNHGAALDVSATAERGAVLRRPGPESRPGRLRLP